MSIPSFNFVWDNMLKFTRDAQERGIDPFAWSFQLSRSLKSEEITLPSVELAQMLVSHICWANNVPMAWKYLEQAIEANLVPPLLVLALLSVRVLPSRRQQPAAYRLYLELVKRYTFSFKAQIGGLSCQRVISSIDGVLGLSQVFSFQVKEPGILIVTFIFAIVWQLLDAVLNDEGISVLIHVKPRWIVQVQGTEAEKESKCWDRQSDYQQNTQKINTEMTIMLIKEFFNHKITSKLFYLAAQNLPSQWDEFLQHCQLLARSPMMLSNSTLTPDVLLQLSSSFTSRSYNEVVKNRPHRDQNDGKNLEAFISTQDHCYETSSFALWIPLDVFLEDCTDGSQVAASCAVEILTGLIKTVRTFNGTTWYDAFLAAWLAALRLVQRERIPIEGPVPRLDTRLSILLTVTTLSIAQIIEEDENMQLDVQEWNCHQQRQTNVPKSCRKDLVLCLQVLGDYEDLLSPPMCVVSMANQAAAKAMMFVSGISVGSSYFEYLSTTDIPIQCYGNMWHLIVEACIARGLLDTSAYFWPGYVNGQFSQIPHAVQSQLPVWSALMKGAPLTPSMVNSLVMTPASCRPELERIFEIGVNGSNDEKAYAATVLCGASLIRGWNVQEYTVHLILKLLSPSAPPDHTASESYLLNHASILYILLTGISPVDCVQIFSLQGLVPELAAILMAICEDLGRCAPNVFWSLPTGEEISVYAVFSSAFILLLRLWKFNHPPVEHCVYGDGAPVGSQLTPEYVLLLRNSRGISPVVPRTPKSTTQVPYARDFVPKQPIFLDSFPNLKVWYRQHQACIASPLSGLIHGSPAHQLVDDLLRMIFRKMNAGGSNQSGSAGVSGASSLSSSTSSSGEDYVLRPQLPAWDILAAVPFVLDAALTACSHGNLSPRDLATGLKDLADFLPASVAAIVSYFSAEVTRAVWKPAFMNGTDWPSPAANLCAVGEQIKKIVAGTGVSVPSLDAGCFPATLPLPLAAFVSFTITYKLDRSSELLLNLAGPALENLAGSCRWPSMPIVAALWAQKVKRWNDFLIFSASRTVFQHNTDAVVQLLKSCFTATIGLSGVSLSSTGGVGYLLGHGIGSQCSGNFSPVAPGILYLRIYRSIRDVTFVPEKILSLLMLCVKEVSGQGQDTGKMAELKKSNRTSRKHDVISLSVGMTKMKVSAGLGASLLWLSGGFSLVKILFSEILPSWFLSPFGPENAMKSEATALLRGYALAHFAVLCGAFSWGIDIKLAPKRHRWLIGSHLEFLAAAFEGKISIGCDSTTWRAYVLKFVGLVVKCAPTWFTEAKVETLKSLFKGLRQWKQEELAFSLLGVAGTKAMGAAAQLIIAENE